MARPRRQTYTMQQYINNVEEGYISNDVAIQRNPAWKPIVDGLVVTILNDDYIPPLILAEEESGKIVIVDGGSRTAAFMMICKGNYKIKSSVEDPIIKYKAMEKDENGNQIWKDAEFDIRNKTFDKFPKELQKKFFEYQVETVIHECNAGEVAKYLRRYNIHTGMNANQKMFIYLPNFADHVKAIVNRKFFLNHSEFSDSNKEKGLLERVVVESVMTMFHFDKWNKNGKKNSIYLNENASEEEFNILNDNIARLEKIVKEDTKTLFNDKNTFIWLTLFNKFIKLGLDDTKFADFMHEFVNGLRNKSVDGKLFDKADENGSTKDKSVITDKLYILETLMFDFLHIDGTDNTTNPETFISEMVDIDMETIQEDMDLYVETLDGEHGLKEECIKVGSKLLDKQNRLSLLAMIVYSYKEGVDLDDWMREYATNNNTYFMDQRKNYLHMKQSYEHWKKKGKVA